MAQVAGHKNGGGKRRVEDPVCSATGGAAEAC